MQSRNRVFVTRDIPGSGLSMLEDAGCEVVVHKGEDAFGARALEAAAKGFDGLLTLLSDRVDRHLMESNPRLRAVANYAVGFDNIDVTAATELGVLVTNTPDVLTDATAELAIALLFAAARRIVEGDSMMRSGGFGGWAPKMLLGVDIRGKTLGLLGAGRIGQAVGRRAFALGMRVLYCECGGSRKPEFELETGARAVPFDELLSSSDFLSVHVPLTHATRGMIGEAQISTMKRTAILVNTARGPIVDEKALASALAKGKLRAAALDVYEQEPAVEPALLGLKNVVLAPHIGSATEETRDEMGRTAASNLIDALLGRKPRNMVNPEAWERRRI